ncbi:aldo/keto reductase [Modestobacter marinus]|uniref:aldo/keto reductase n=1 Tax=Modestobacter marinus TaxID=477641 RepID=UPI0027E1D2FA|nr:aldo/keto reductase [Modestobacter marinus]
MGVSNFMPDHLDRLLAETSGVPAVNQIEVHPYFRQSELLAVHAEHGILSQAWSPIGGITSYRDGSRGSTLQNPTMQAIAAEHGRTPAQVMLRWPLQQGRRVIPKSVTPSRIAENIDVFDFELTADQLLAIDALDTGVRGGPEPAQTPGRASACGSPRPDAVRRGPCHYPDQQALPADPDTAFHGSRTAPRATARAPSPSTPDLNRRARSRASNCHVRRRRRPGRKGVRSGHRAVHGRGGARGARLRLRQRPAPLPLHAGRGRGLTDGPRVHRRG